MWFICISLPISEHLDAEVPAVSANHVVWKGFVNMSGLAKFATTAYPVSGRATTRVRLAGL